MGTYIDDVGQRLEMIFTRLFPYLEGADVHSASIYTVRDWDPIATLSLIVEAEDEFGLDIGFEAAEDIETFGDLYRTVIRTRLAPFSGSLPPGWVGRPLPC